MSEMSRVDRPNASLAWADALVQLLKTREHRLAPLAISFSGTSGNTVNEHAGIRSALDDALAAAGQARVQTVANTIFPESLWRWARGNRQALYSEYLENLSSYVAMEPSKNSRGLYFARLIAFKIDPRRGRGDTSRDIHSAPHENQLEFIIKGLKPRTRHSMFQAAVFDPVRDHSPATRMSFPCLQHVTFVPDFASGTLSLNAFYATQQLLTKAYGNFLGLSRLGAFVAGEASLVLDRVTCLVGEEKIGRSFPKDVLRPLALACERALVVQADAVVAGG